MRSLGRLAEGKGLLLQPMGTVLSLNTWAQQTHMFTPAGKVGRAIGLYGCMLVCVMVSEQIVVSLAFHESKA